MSQVFQYNANNVGIGFLVALCCAGSGRYHAFTTLQPTTLTATEFGSADGLLVDGYVRHGHDPMTRHGE